jgi:uncharacterized protein YjiS (DUF1127 family)
MSDQHRAGGSRPPNVRLAGLARLVYRKVIDSLRPDVRVRAGEEELARLDDRLLRDIGLTGSGIHAAAYGLAEPGEHSLTSSLRASPSERGNVRPQRRAGGLNIAGAPAAPPAGRAARA